MNTPLFLVLVFITAGVLALWYYLRTERGDIACSPLTRRANRRRKERRGVPTAEDLRRKPMVAGQKPGTVTTASAPDAQA